MARLLIAFVLGALIAGTVVYVVRHQAPVEEPTAPPASERVKTPRRPPPAAALVGSPEAVARLAGIEAENARLQEEIDELEASIEAAVAPKDPEAFRFGVPEDAPTFDKADWPALGSHMTKLSELMPGFMKTIAEGGDVAAVIGPVQKHNMPLAQFAIALSRDLGESDMPNKAYTHPAVIANLMRAALQDANEPLTQAQEVAIGALGKAYLSERARGDAAAGEQTIALASLVAEVEAKSRFLASARGVLTATQNGVLFHPDTVGRVGLDLLSPGLGYALRAGAHGTDRDSLEASLVETLLSTAGIEMEDASSLRWVATAWVDEIPSVLEPRTQRNPDVLFPHVDDLQNQAKAQIAATERLLASGELTAEQAKTLRDVATIIQPIVLPSAPAGPAPDEE